MSYRTILVHANLSRHAEARYRLAALLARTFDAHLVGAAVTGVSRFILPGSMEMGGQMLAEQIGILHEAAQRALAQFETVTTRLDVRARESRYVNDDLDGGIALQARYADLIVLGQPDPSEQLVDGRSDLLETLLMAAARPLLVQPYANASATFGTHPLVAWDGSVEATRAITSALPLLREARLVTVAVFDPDGRPGAHGEQPGADIALYLSRHGVPVQVHVQPGTVDTGNALLSLAADLDSDLLVMGGYGHSRFREMLLGGVTRTILNSMTIPVLMAH